MALDRAEKASLRAVDLARQLLDFAKGDQPIKKLISLERILREAIWLTLSGTNVKGIMDIPSQLYSIEADEGLFYQAFNNIILNAVQAMPGGGKLVVNGENVAFDAPNQYGLPIGRYVKISFRDEGCGIPNSDLRKIFDPYFTTKASGTGLGLASAYSTIRNHSGHISVSSKVGVGTEFVIYLPSTGNSGLDKFTGSETVTEAKAGSTVLVMDDDEMIRNLAVKSLGSIGYFVSYVIPFGFPKRNLEF